MMIKRAWGRNQSGEGKMALFIGLVVVAGAIYLLKLMVPPRIDRAELGEFVETQTRSYVVRQITFEQLTAGILAEAGRIGVPLREADIDIADSESRVRVTIQYDLPQDLIGGKTWVQKHEIVKEIPRL